MSELNTFLFITNICVVLLCGALLPIMPFLTRKSFLFGVKVPPEAQMTAEAKALKRNYIILTTVGVLIVLAASLLQYIIAPDYTILAVLYFPLVIIAVQFIVYVPSHSKALKLKSRLGWNVTEMSFADTKTSFTRGNLSAMPYFWYIISLLIVLISFVIMLAKYPSMPDPIPTHWDINMQPDAWKDKSLGTVLLMPIFNLGMVIFMWLIGVLIEKTKLQIDHKEPAKSFAQHQKYRRLMGHGIGVMTVGIAFMFLILGLMSIYPTLNIPFWLILGLGIVPCLPIVIISVRAGQSGTLLKVDAAEISTASNGSLVSNSKMSDDKLWAWGLFYHNPDDPAYFVGNRFGGNIGFNYSRLPVKIGVAIFAVALVACYIWMTLYFLSII
jgi:Predicted membrane protein